MDRPILMLNGQFDYLFPYETTQQPFYNWLGSEDRELKTMPGSHNFPKVDLIRETLGWLDKRLGPVEVLQSRSEQ